MQVVIALTSPLPRPASPARRHRAGWVVLCLWLLVALVPLRAWAATQMGVSMVDEPSAVAAATAELPPCHAPEGGGDAGPAESHTACAQCLFCAPVLAAEFASACEPRPPGNPTPAARAGAAPEGAVDALFKPPRG